MFTKFTNYTFLEGTLHESLSRSWSPDLAASLAPLPTFEPHGAAWNTWANINSHSMEDHEIMEDPLKFQYFQWTPRLVQRMSWHDTPQWPQVALSIGLNYWTGCTATGLLPHALWVLRLEPVACTGQFGCSAGKRQRNVAWPNYLHHLPSWGFPIVSPRSNAF